MEKLIDFDGLFDEKLTQFMEENKNKYTEKQWEDIIPKLYKKFGDTFVAKIKCTPKEYYARMNSEELASTLLAHLQEDIPVPEFLCAEIENRDNIEALLPLLNCEHVSAATYAVNLIGDDPRAYDAYFSLLESDKTDEDVRGDIIEIFKLHADVIKEQALAAFENGTQKESMLEILSRTKSRDERVYEILMQAFLSGEETPMHASYLAAYGDERALPVLLEKIEDRSIGFVEFQELKYAIEALGGEYNEERDFSADKDYLAVEEATSKLAAENNELKS